MQNSSLYLVTPDGSDTELLLRQCEALLATQPAYLQYRNKQADAAMQKTQALALLGICRETGVPLIVNDNLALALEIDADGLHLGRSDGGLDAARAALGPGKILGASCYGSLALAESALNAGADYVAFGAAYASRTKPEADCVPLGLYREARHRFPQATIVAIGGITVERARALLEEGVDYLAVIGDVFDAPSPVARARAYSRLKTDVFSSHS